MTPADLTAARKRLGLTQPQLGRALGLSDANADRTVRRWEQGDVPIPLSVEIALWAFETEGTPWTIAPGTFVPPR